MLAQDYCKSHFGALELRSGERVAPRCATLPPGNRASIGSIAIQCRSLKAQLRGKTTRTQKMKRQDARDAKKQEEPSQKLDRDSTCVAHEFGAFLETTQS